MSAHSTPLCEASHRRAWQGFMSRLCPLGEPVCLGGQRDAGWSGTVQVGMTGATRFCPSCLISCSPVGACLWQRQGSDSESVPPCVSDPHASAHMVFASVPKAEACHVTGYSIKAG